MIQEVVIFLQVFTYLQKSFGKFQELKDAPHARREILIKLCIKSIGCLEYNKKFQFIPQNIETIEK